MNTYEMQRPPFSASPIIIIIIILLEPEKYIKSCSPPTRMNDAANEGGERAE